LFFSLFLQRRTGKTGEGRKSCPDDFSVVLHRLREERKHNRKKKKPPNNSGKEKAKAPSDSCCFVSKKDNELDSYPVLQPLW
jgi:hypothetical protein